MAVITKITITPSPYLKNLLSKLSKSDIDVSRTNAYNNYRLRCFRYWDDRVYTVFYKRLSMGLPVTGQLGKSLRVTYNKPQNAIYHSMASLKHSGSPNESGGKTNDYGRYIRGNVRKMSRGVYNPKLDRKMPHGMTRPVNPQYWKRWTAMYKLYAGKQTKMMYERAFKEVFK